MKRWVTLIALCLLAAGSAFAQLPGGDIVGTVMNQQDGLQADAIVTVKGPDATYDITSDSEGMYRFLNLAPGRYELEAKAGELTGSAVAVVEVGKTIKPVILLGGNETVVVTSPAPPTIDGDAIGTATNITRTELDLLPSNRDVFSQAGRVPGVLIDQVNVGGNETGQQALVTGKGVRQQDTVWMVDGIEVTDMGAPGQSPTYFNWDSFEEIQISTAGNDIRYRTGGVGVQLVTKRGTNTLRGSLRTYFSNDALEWSNVPAELQPSVTPNTADHTIQTADFGFDIGGPLIKDRAWFYVALMEQDIRIHRRSTGAIDKTELLSPQVKANWQVTGKDMINVLVFNGKKVKDGRSAGVPGISFEAPEATLHQDNGYSDPPLHGLWKIGHDRVMTSNMFVSAKYAYYNTGLSLTPLGGMDAQAGRSLFQGRSWGSFARTIQTRPQHHVTADATSFLKGLSASHELSYGFGFRRVLTTTDVEWPGNGVLAIEQTATDLRAQVFRQSHGGNQTKYLDFFVADTMQFADLTLNAGVRYDRQWGDALPATVTASKAFPNIIPGLEFAGYEAPFVWNNLSPRIAASYRLDQVGKMVARASYTRAPGQLALSTVGIMNPTGSTTPGNVTYRWTDRNGDRVAQTDEVDTTQQIGAAGGGFNPANPTAVVSTNLVDPNLKAPVTQSVVAGVDRELMSNTAMFVEYSYTRTSNLFGNLTSNLTPRRGTSLADYVPSPTPLTPDATVKNLLPNGESYSVQTYFYPGTLTTPGFYTQNVPGYYTDYHGIEVNLVKRLADRWMGRLAFGYNNAREHFTKPEGRYDTNGNPTPTASEPLRDGGQFAPVQAIAGGVFLNAKWQFTANGLYQLPHDFEVAASVFGRQGYPLPIYRSGVVLGPDTNLNILVSPEVDTFRLDNVWTTDFRIAKTFRLPARARDASIRLIADAFNLFNANTELVRNSNVASTAYQSLSKNLSPRILRLGLVVGF
jgi:hypothetical protein